MVGGFWSFKSHCHEIPPSYKATPPYPSKTVLPTGDQVFKVFKYSYLYMLWGLFSSLPLEVIVWVFWFLPMYNRNPWRVLSRWVICKVLLLSIPPFKVYSISNWTQSLLYARQAFYHWAISRTLCIFIWDRVSLSYLCWLLTLFTVQAGLQLAIPLSLLLLSSWDYRNVYYTGKIPAFIFFETGSNVPLGGSPGKRQWLFRSWHIAVR